VASVISGVETAHRALTKQGKIEDRDIKFVIFAGDGATYDIGLQFISAAIERGHRFLYVCLNNEAYMNTGIQRSSATPMGAWTTTTPVGKVVPGKMRPRKDLVAIIAAHNIPYAAQAAPHAWRDLMAKVHKAIATDGPSFVDVLSPCPRGWRYNSNEAIAMSRLATETYMWPLYEVDNGNWRLNSMLAKRPLTDWLKSQGRFAHLLRPKNEGTVDRLHEEVDKDWDRLLKHCTVS
jgi:pyruvate ferredoxin oxidoreductase beta subunit